MISLKNPDAAEGHNQDVEPPSSGGAATHVVLPTKDDTAAAGGSKGAPYHRLANLQKAREAVALRKQAKQEEQSRLQSLKEREKTLKDLEYQVKE